MPQEIEKAFEKRKARLRGWLADHSLRQIQWEATRRCDMKCLHCGSDCRASNNDNELSEDEIVNVFESLAVDYSPASFELISITGGEPLMRDDLPAIIRRIRALGFSHITIQTNGNKLSGDQNLLPDLVDAGISGLGLNMDGVGPSHDLLRGQNGHFESMKQLAGRVLHETSLYLTVTTVVSSTNIDELPYLAQILTNMNVHRWRLIELQPMGRAHKADAAYLNSDDFKRLVNFVKYENMKSTSLDKSVLPSVELACTGWFGTEYEGIVRPYIWHCHAGVCTLGIWSNGDIGGCTDIDHKRTEGNVRTDSIVEVWQNRFGQYRDWHSRKTGVCEHCDQWSLCHGGALHLRAQGKDISHCPYLLLHDKPDHNFTNEEKD